MGSPDETEPITDASPVAVAEEPAATVELPTNTRPLFRRQQRIHTKPPTAEPTEAPTEPAAQDPLAVLVSFEDPADGEALFNENHTLPDGQVWACSTCHNVDVDEIKIGPTLLGLPARAGETVEGLSDVRYIYNSIVVPQEHIVEGFEDMTLMPAGWDEVFTEQQIYSIVAYLLTLEG